MEATELLFVREGALACAELGTFQTGSIDMYVLEIRLFLVSGSLVPGPKKGPKTGVPAFAI